MMRVPGSKATATQRLFELYKRHGIEVRGAVQKLLTRHSKDIFTRTLPGDSLLRIVYESNSVVSVPAIGSDGSPTNYFWNRGNVFEARFRGAPPVLIQNFRKGCLYLQYLLARPNRSFSVYDVAAEFDVGFCEEVSLGNYDAAEMSSGYEFTQGKHLSDLGDVIDKRAIREYGERLHELVEEKREAQTNNDIGRVELLETEIAEISDHLKSAVGLGRSRKIKDQRKNLRDAVRNSIDRSISQIQQSDEVFGAHLKNFITKGRILAYLPDPSVSWSVRPGRQKISKEG